MVRIANPYTVCPQNDSTSSAMCNRLQVCLGVARGHTGKSERERESPIKACERLSSFVRLKAYTNPIKNIYMWEISINIAERNKT